MRIAGGMTAVALMLATMPAAAQQSAVINTPEEAAAALRPKQAASEPVASDGSIALGDDERGFCIVETAQCRATAQGAKPTVKERPRNSQYASFETRGRGKGKSRSAPVRQQPREAADMSLTFANGSFELDEAAKARVRIFATALTEPKYQLNTARFRIEGHTNSVGARPTNMTLSDRRARSVATYLTELGVTPDRLAAQGFGPDQPLPGRARSDGANRRVEIVRR